MNKSHGLYVLFVILIVFVIQLRSTEDLAKSTMCKYYVAWFISSTVADYYSQFYSDSASETERSPVRTLKPPGGKWLNTRYDVMMTTSAVNGRFMALKMPRRFLNYDVYLVSEYTTHSYSYYKLGIDDQFKFVRFWGFGVPEPISQSENFALFMGQNDELEFDSTDLPMSDEVKVQQFIGDWIQLTQFSDHPNRFKILSNQYVETEFKGRFEGTCSTAELRDDFQKGRSVIYRDWSYIIPFDGGHPYLELLSVREVEDNARNLWP